MQNFRINQAYRLSLYFLLLALVSWGAIFLFDELRLYVFVAVFVFSIPVLLLAAFLLRAISLDPLKRWTDIIFVLSAAALKLFLMFMSHTCPTMVTRPGTVFMSQRTFGSLFEACSPYNILGEIRIASTALIAISLAFNLKFLIYDIKKKRPVSSSTP
ncbi:MAG: hypothetical protein M3M85_01850 [bacterium]|nr:hypothetical protein [bacterium]